jgi:hypothetical protein
MNRKQITSTSVITAIVITSIAFLLGMPQTPESIAADAPKSANEQYGFAEGVNPKATFQFREATVTYDFQMYDQTNSLFASSAGGGTSLRTPTPEFTLRRIVGDTPYLHQAVDQTWQYKGRTTPVEYPYRSFDITVDFVNGEKSLRVFKYKDCAVSNYVINTRTDNEEAYIPGKKTVFALVETYTFSCSGWQPESPTYKALNNGRS